MKDEGQKDEGRRTKDEGRPGPVIQFTVDSHCNPHIHLLDCFLSQKKYLFIVIDRLALSH